MLPSSRVRLVGRRQPGTASESEYNAFSSNAKTSPVMRYYSMIVAKAPAGVCAARDAALLEKSFDFYFLN